MHAPVVLQHYLVSMGSGNHTGAKMIDIAAYVAKYRRGAALVDYLKNNRGGNSEDFASEIFLGASDEDNFDKRTLVMGKNSLHEACQRITQRLTNEPALVSRFKVYQNFMDGDSSFLNANFPKKTLLGRHAMVLIGYRKCVTHGIVFLLQNWWKGRHFIEVSASYLAACDATVIFVKTELTDIPTDFPVIRSVYAETTVDCGETYDDMCST